ncbi:rhythmically expressed gene 2 protein-like [Belonocnema kinseyi]|uniref:rhythmically expressed gene 2 protein-like n=1 Tax=Belonocnema kinseyi TaxID=2817044 RepID=UPI00143DDCC7|nr:rhythmically expressed gene 2 protein-like [Belonocnema kinseyi]
MRFVKPKLITFDVTGTLLMTKVEKYYAAAGAQHGVLVDPSKLARSFKTNFKQISKEHPIFGKHTGMGSEKWWRTLVYAVFKDQISNIPEEKLSKVADTVIECYRTRMCWEIYPGAVEILDYLQKEGILVGVISNFDDGLDSILQSLDIKSYFSFILCSYQFGREKPDSQIFEEALRIFQNIKETHIFPQEALHIGDRVDTDYLGAKNAKWNAIFIKRDDEPVDPLVSKYDIVSDLEDLKINFEKDFSHSKVKT